jgi:hypothetical protein
MSYKDERDGSFPELFLRKAITSILYYRGYKWIFPNRPYYAPGAIRFLKKIINSESRVFEYGCGKSSLWYSKRVKEYIAVEHDVIWFERIKDGLARSNTENSQLLFVPLNRQGDAFDWQKEWSPYSQIKRPPQNRHYIDYIRSISQFPDKFFDLIIIDGRERLHCLLEALPKLSDTGTILFDDSHRPRYKELFSIMKNWEKKSFDFGLAQTTFFSRKSQ